VYSFHIWPRRIRLNGLGTLFPLYRDMAEATLEYFFSCYDIQHIIGDISKNNPLAHSVLKRLGYNDFEEVQASYLGEKGFYYRYKIDRQNVFKR
jgi:hypothetical protein